MEGYQEKFASIEKDTEYVTQNVLLEEINFSFLYQKGEVSKFFKVLAEIEDDKFLSHRSASIIVNSVWNMIYSRIQIAVFYPYLVYFFCFICYIVFIFNPKKEVIKEETYFMTDSGPITIILLTICVLYSLLQLIFEIKQMI